MKPTPDDDQILTDSAAIDRMVDTWQNIGLGMVDAEFHAPWLIVRRGGGGYSTFISTVDDTVVTILDNSATTRHVPKEHRPDDHVSDADKTLIREAFNSASGGMYPLEEAFAIAFERGDGRKELHIGLYDDTVAVEEA